jgi:hypothetical protein
MSEILIFVLLALNVVQFAVNSRERKDLLNRIMSKDFQDYNSIIKDPPKGRSFLKLKQGGGERG